MNPLSREGDWRVNEPHETAQFRYLCVRVCPSLFVYACVCVCGCLCACLCACAIISVPL